MLLRATGSVAVRRSSRTSTCWMNCRTRSSCACRAVWSAAAMLPRQSCSRSGAWYAVTHPGYALPTTGVNHMRISGDDRYGYCRGRLAQWQRAAPAVPARAGWIAVPAHHTHVAQFGVRQPCCRASRTHDPARGTPLPILAMHYPYLVSTTCVSAGMIAMGTVVDDWHSGNALL